MRRFLWPLCALTVALVIVTAAYLNNTGSGGKPAGAYQQGSSGSNPYKEFTRNK
jgi:hypothetical protein